MGRRPDLGDRAQDHGRRGWVVALIWAIALEITAQSLKALHLLTSLSQ
jgi:hypothetical protein